MAAGSIVGSFIGGRLLGLVPGAVLFPTLRPFGALGSQGLAAPIMPPKPDVRAPVS